MGSILAGVAVGVFVAMLVPARLRLPYWGAFVSSLIVSNVYPDAVWYGPVLAIPAVLYGVLTGVLPGGRS